MRWAPIAERSRTWDLTPASRASRSRRDCAAGCHGRTVSCRPRVGSPRVVKSQRKGGAKSPRVDEELQRETESLVRGAPVESRVEEGRLKEDAGEDEFAPSGYPVPPGELGADDVDARRELSRHLRSSAFPADRTRLLAEAIENHAPPPIVAVLERLRADVTYHTVHEVWVAIADPEAAQDGSAGLRRAAAEDPLGARIERSS